LGLPLAHVGHTALETAKGVQFPMMRDNKSVRVIVSREILDGINNRGERTDAVTKFAPFRKIFESVASYKYDHGHSKGPITIVSEDLKNYADVVRGAI
jgi:hypothetical protein